ncbi:hypothetical protein [Alloactinosynnema sp. L-07]|uniref:hypothetical protein n=1 Tax=Alloactinosynnema sp. L-07 TaxID=1653480 RepID=UPI00065EF8E2|nr:hypothetical protein [Alloactinosynnema sp. L-07]CRK59070.1 hypothetical protein [Alloactinosynnema sp. L-07]
MRKLITHVHVTEIGEDGKPTGRSGTFGPADDLPDWARAAITNPFVWDGPVDEAEVREAMVTVPPLPDGVTGASVSTGDEVDPNRPRGNASRPDWAAYAGSLTPPVEVTGAMSRDDIIAAVDARPRG